jgi:hypothetical protein
MHFVLFGIELTMMTRHGIMPAVFFLEGTYAFLAISIVATNNGAFVLATYFAIIELRSLAFLLFVLHLGAARKPTSFRGWEEVVGS